MIETMKKDLESFIDEMTTTIICYMDENGRPVAKAMLKPRKRKDLNEFWFSTNTSSNKVKCFKENPNASLYFFDKETFRGVSLLGVVEVLEDSESKKEIWQEGDTLYYSLGVEDPDYCVLKFKADGCRYYSNFCSKDIEI